MKIALLASILLSTHLIFAKSPTVTLRYSFIFDSWCTQQTNIEITESEIAKLAEIFPILQSEWDNAGSVLLAKLESITGKSFMQSEFIGTVFLCKKTPSMSMPLLINGNWFVTNRPQSPEIIVDIIFHELIHTFLVDHFPNLRSSPLAIRYSKEGPGVLAHLHLMALQKKVYRELGYNEWVDRVIQFDSELYKGDYKRSWEIVNAEGEDRFIDELK